MLLSEARSDVVSQAQNLLALEAVTPQEPMARHGYRSSGSNRWIGLGGTILIYTIGAIGFFITITATVGQKATPPALAMFDLKAPTSPPEAPPEKREAPRPVKKKVTKPEPAPVMPIEPTMVSPVMVPSPVVKPTSTELAPQDLETAAPRTAPAPPAPQVSNPASDTWEGRVLAQLNGHRRYPRIAQARRQQGVPYIRFVMDREGKVLSVRLERSSGVPDLDREAVALPTRAQPLPKPPTERVGDTLELVVPVEFFLR
ncbi:TonB family protein [Sphingobium sp.]|uniref:TonB family protein n=1 Tax=Sphingobium sp. TaxID=1912891 RepID=UPI003BB551AA